MGVQVKMEELMQVRIVSIEAIEAIGFRGRGPEDEKKLFADLRSRMTEIQNRKDDHEYLIIGPEGLFAAAAVTNTEFIPEGMVLITIPADEYNVFRFEEKYIGDFWNYFSNPDAQAEYILDCDKIRFEIFKEELQPKGVTEIYFPVNSKKKSETTKKKSLKPTGHQQVLQFLNNLEHPLKEEIEEVRKIILSANDQINEHIKWNAPSFTFENEDRVTFNFHGKGYFRLVFHCGAKVKNIKSEGRLFDDTTGLLDWVTNDRAMVTFTDMNDVSAKKDRLVEVITNWLKATSA
ncbi:MAG: hypothetical protein K0Q73_6954 [Paenibacillus sp.]|jgi:predicted transcriptional regulator YdeE|nr:hypothetical protein [Paenibacillus sp.]